LKVIINTSIDEHSPFFSNYSPISGNAGAKIATGVIGIDAGTSLDYSMPNVHYVPATADCTYLISYVLLNVYRNFSSLHNF